MRFFLGMVVGVLMTIGVAYLIDASSSTSGESTAQVDHKPMVNWDVVHKHVSGVTARAREAWRKVAG